MSGREQIKDTISLAPPRKKKRPQVALLIDMSSAYGRGLLRGIYAYVREHGPWSTSLTELGRHDPAPKWLIDDLHVDGVIARIENKRIANSLLKLHVPVVNVSSALNVAQFPWIVPDHSAISRCAAEHFFERGFRNLGFCGNPLFSFSKCREKEFFRFALEAGCSCSVFRQPIQSRKHHFSMSEEQHQLGDWVKQLPKPVGVMACNDIRGQQLLEVCERFKVTVPEEVSVVGVDNDEILCSWTNPQLSSVIPDAYNPGYEAARVLQHLMNGKTAKKHEVRYGPLGIAIRQSSDVFAISDTHIARALNIIRARACEGLSVYELVKELPFSRRVFDNRFTNLLGRTPHDEIVRLQFQKATQLLKETSLPVAEIARQSGFEHAEYLSVAFKKQYGVTPSMYRHKNRSTFSSTPSEHPLNSNNVASVNHNGRKGQK